MTLSAQLLNRLVMEQFFYALRSCGEILGHILLIAVIAAVFTNFSNVFQNRQISEVSFYMLYILLIALCLNSFQAVTDWVGGGIEDLTDFMGVFCPIYFLAVAMAKGSVTSVAFYNLVLFLIYLAQLLIMGFLLPVIHIYYYGPGTELPFQRRLPEQICGTYQDGNLVDIKDAAGLHHGLNVIQGLIKPGH